MASEKVTAMIEELKALSVLELSELDKVVVVVFGVLFLWLVFCFFF